MLMSQDYCISMAEESVTFIPLNETAVSSALKGISLYQFGLNKFKNVVHIRDSTYVLNKAIAVNLQTKKIT